MATTNQKSTIDTHTQKEKESKHNTKYSHQITRKERKKKGRKEKRKLQKQPENNQQNDKYVPMKSMWDSGKEPTYQRRRQRDESSMPMSGRSPGVGNGNSFQCSCLEN